MLHPLIEARLEDAEAFIRQIPNRELAQDLECEAEWQENIDFLNDLRNGAYAGGNWR